MSLWVNHQYPSSAVIWGIREEAFSVLDAFLQCPLLMKMSEATLQIHYYVKKGRSVHVLFFLGFACFAAA